MISMQWWRSVLWVLLSGTAAVTASAAVPVPLPGTTPIDVTRVRVGNPAVIPTSGTWRFALTHGAMVGGHFVSQSATASSSQADASAGNAVDGKNDTRWCADSDAMPQWWQIDLGTTESVSGIDLSWEYGDGRYQYKVETGPDETHLRTAADRTQSQGVGDGGLTWPAAAARVVRVVVTSATNADGERKWASIREARISIVRGGKTVVWSPPNNQADSHADDFAAPEFDDSQWHDLPVPSNWEVLGYSRPTYFGPDAAVGLYRRMIEIPASFAGKTVLWHFDGVTDSAEIWVNGQRMGYHEGGFTAFDIDVSAAIKPGRNLLAVRVCKSTPTDDLDTGDYWLLGGIHRESYLMALPIDHLSDVTVVTTLDADDKNAQLATTVKVSGTAGDDFKVTARLFTAAGAPVDVPPITAGQKIGDAGSTTIGLDLPVEAPLLWSAEKPNLYYVLLTLQAGNTGPETVEQRFGFRQIDIKDGVLLWNGVPIKCTGTCRHEEWSALGHALTEHEWQTDIAMMKAANINAVRTSHYNHAERFLELCDEKGIYVLDEIPACWVSNSDPKLRQAFIQHATETLSRDKNKPCVLAWSCGNESGWGPNFKAMVDYVAATDPTRPRFVSEQNKSRDPQLSISDHHYPQDLSLKKIATTDPGPSVITEGPHIFYNIGHQAYDYGLNDLWGMALANQWDRVWPSKPLFGAFIWEWQDQGLADKFPDKTDVDANGLRRENSKGIVTGYRVPKPEYYHVKMVYSPVSTDQREVHIDGKNWSAGFTNRYAFTDLSELVCRWQAMTTTGTDRELGSGTVSLSCPPGASTLVSFPITAQADTLRVSFTDRNGVEVYAVRLHIPGAPLPLPPPALAGGEFKTADNADAIAVTSSAFGLSINRSSGLISITRGAKPLMNGPTLNLGELRVDDGDFGNKNDAPWIGSHAPPVLKNARVIGGFTTPDQKQWAASVTADVTLAENPTRVLGLLTYDITLQPNGQIDWAYRLKWTADDMQAWEFGLKFDLIGDDQFRWYRHGQWTEYPAGHIGANQGTVTHEDRSFASTKRDTVWAAVTPRDPTGDGIAISAAESPLHTRCRFTDGVTTLFSSTAVSVDRDFSSGYVDNTRITFKQGHTYQAALHSWIVAGKP